jgi:hypothetical protein
LRLLGGSDQEEATYRRSTTPISMRRSSRHGPLSTSPLSRFAIRLSTCPNLPTLSYNVVIARPACVSLRPHGPRHLSNRAGSCNHICGAADQDATATRWWTVEWSQIDEMWMRCRASLTVGVLDVRRMDMRRGRSPQIAISAIRPAGTQHLHSFYACLYLEVFPWVSLAA